ncbi:MAG: GNAT family N-acetyltransferase [Tannerella sp.]|jgi:ribosomal protein S18 acetylase RimI-like enzyme|nr:GNAT family N-acetyltransferase [Tannerella sp.]
MATQDTVILKCDFNNEAHTQAVKSLMNAYIEDEMGGGEPLGDADGQRLIDGLQRYKTITLLAESGGVFCGLLVAFENFSTFTVRPMINIHDVFTAPTHRGKGIGRRLMEALIAEAQRLNASRITLEVRDDNLGAQKLYRSMGFNDVEPPHFYWRKYL